MANNSKKRSINIGFVLTRFAGNDGVSLETQKWVDVLEQMGHRCFFLSGQCDYGEPDTCHTLPEADFKQKDINEISSVAFSNRKRPIDITNKIHKLRKYFKDQIYQFVKDFEIQLIIAENSLSIPMNIPLGMGLTEYIAETGIPTIAHHHDFFWERQRFFTNCIGDFLSMAFPPLLPSIQHVVINSLAEAELSRRTGISSMIIPNVMNFENPPAPADEYTKDIRFALGIADDEFMFLQPTRVVQRKGIEHAIELIRQTGLNAKLVISHASGDEGFEYEQRVKSYAELLDVSVNFVSKIIQNERGLTDDGNKVYTLGDAYQHADLVTYPSTIEGFGNAFLEAIYYRKPLFVNNYSIFDMDIKPKGFKVIDFDGYITKETARRTCQLLADQKKIKDMVNTNYSLGKRHYSYAALRRRLQTLISASFGENKAI